MEILFQTQTIKYLAEKRVDDLRQEQTGEITIPESMPELGRVVDCFGTGDLVQQFPEGGFRHGEWSIDQRWFSVSPRLAEIPRESVPVVEKGGNPAVVEPFGFSDRHLTDRLAGGTSVGMPFAVLQIDKSLPVDRHNTFFELARNHLD